MDTLPRFFFRSKSRGLVYLAISALTAACGSSSSTSTAPSSPGRCEITFGTVVSTLPATGGTGSIPVKTERECQWTATSEAPWLTLSGGTSGQGDGTIQYSVRANVDPVQRTGAIVANEKRVELTQAGGECKFELSSSSTSFPNSGGSNTVQVQASSSMCAWTASSRVDWIDIQSGREGKGSGSVAYVVAATTGPSRTGTLTVAGQTLAVTQGDGCSVTVAPEQQSIPASGGNGALRLAVADGCAWTARSTVDWIAIASAVAGTGPASVAYSVSPNVGPPRTGKISVAARTFTVEQASGCTFTISPATREVGVAGQAVTVAVTTGPVCTWTARSNASWIAVSSGAGGAGSGAVQLMVAMNTTESRSGTATIAGHTFTIVQAGCTATVSPTYQLIPPVGAVGAFQVSALSACPWSAVPGASWIRITSGGSGAGAGTVGFIVEPNPGAARTATIEVLNQKFLVRQEPAGN